MQGAGSDCYGVPTRSVELAKTTKATKTRTSIIRVDLEEGACLFLQVGLVPVVCLKKTQHPKLGDIGRSPPGRTRSTIGTCAQRNTITQSLAALATPIGLARTTQPTPTTTSRPKHFPPTEARDAADTSKSTGTSRGPDERGRKPDERGRQGRQAQRTTARADTSKSTKAINATSASADCGSKTKTSNRRP